MRKSLAYSIAQVSISIIALVVIMAGALIWLGLGVGAIRANCGTGSTKADGLVSAFSIDPNFGSSSCVSGSLSYIPVNQARIVVSDYQALYNKYYARSADLAIPKITISGTITSPIVGQGTNNSLIYSNGDLTLQNTVLAGINNGKVLVFFVNGNLNIQTDITEAKGNQNGGVVFVVKGNVNINVNVREINAVIISGGVICSACDASSIDVSNDTAPFTDPQLIINGSLIALDPTKNIDFTREYNTNIEPAEIINAQAKYLVILDDIFGERVKIYKEI